MTVPRPLIDTLAPDDQMGAHDVAHYMGVGVSALHGIHVALRAAQVDPVSVRTILDLPCGHGRVLRHLQAHFPEAQLTACDLLEAGVQFCAQTFGATPVLSHPDPTHVPLEPASFDLIWVGSLLTHLGPAHWLPWLTMWTTWLRPAGVLVVSTHGALVASRVAQNPQSYELTPAEVPRLLEGYYRTGCGYVPYPNRPGAYGFALSHLPWVITQFQQVPVPVRLCAAMEQAWDGHHDLVACQRLT